MAGMQTGRSKPILTVDEQIAHLKARGVTFNHVSEADAAAYLRNRTYFFKFYAYRSLFQKRVGGEHNGEYAGLDFGALKELASFDRTLRYVLLPLTLDVEHCAKVKLMREAEKHGEDGYTLVSDYLASLGGIERERRLSEVRRLRNDIYCGDLVRKYSLPYDMPLWVFLEIVSFGTLIDLYLYCAKLWNDTEMRDEHYLLRQAKGIRNACAHSSNIVNGFGDVGSNIATNNSVSHALKQVNVAKRVRSAKMRNPRLKQIVTLLYLHRLIVPEGAARDKATSSLEVVNARMREVMADIPTSYSVQSSFGFLSSVLDSWFEMGTI